MTNTGTIRSWRGQPIDATTDPQILVGVIRELATTCEEQRREIGNLQADRFLVAGLHREIAHLENRVVPAAIAGGMALGAALLYFAP